MKNTNLPQLRVRTEFSFRQTAFGAVADVLHTLGSMQCSAAGIVDGGTWGHVKWARAAAKTGVRPLFGTEIVIPTEDGRRPAAWLLAKDIASFYTVSTAARKPDADLQAVFANATGVLRFAGAALKDPACFDYIDLNPASPIQNHAAYQLHIQTRKPLVVTSDNAYAQPADKAAFMALVDREKVSPQHLVTQDELRACLSFLSDDEFKVAVFNTYEAAERATSKLLKAPLIAVPGDLRELCEQGKLRRLASGEIASWTDEYEQRLQRELTLIAEKDFASYFLVVADLVSWAKQHMMVGAGRGSSSGSLVCWLTRITEVNPLEHGLLFERFIDVNRADLPDCDLDFSDQKRDMAFAYLNEKYDAANVARIGNINTMKPRSIMAQVCGRLGIPDHERFAVANVLIEYPDGDSRFGHELEDTLSQTDPGKKFLQRYPEAAVMFRLENHASHSGVHAAGVIVCNDPVSNYCTVNAEGIAQIDKPDAEYLNLLKIDVLGLRTLGVIEDAGVVTGDELYRLKLDDPEVFALLNEHRFAGIFQFEGQAQRRIASQINIKSFRDIDHITALARPGPMGGGATQHYIDRAVGREKITYVHPMMEDFLGKTMGVILYQEQTMKVCREIGKFSWEKVSEIRKAISKSKGREALQAYGEEFVLGAETLNISRHDASAIWESICAFGGYGMNSAHTVSYGIVSYWCAHLKRYHPLEFAAACLRGAKDDEQTLALLREITTEGMRYLPFDIERSDANWKVIDGVLVGGFMNLHGIGPAKAAKALEDRAAGVLTDKEKAKILAHEVKFAELYPLHAAYPQLFADPYSYGCAKGSVICPLDQMPENGGNVLIVCSVLSVEPRDENEPGRIARRGREITNGPTKFLNIYVTDDTGTTVTVRIDRWDFDPIGKMAEANLKEGDALLIRGNRIPGFMMVKVNVDKPRDGPVFPKMWCLNRKEALQCS